MGTRSNSLGNHQSQSVIRRTFVFRQRSTITCDDYSFLQLRNSLATTQPWMVPPHPSSSLTDYNDKHIQITEHPFSNSFNFNFNKSTNFNFKDRHGYTHRFQTLNANLCFVSIIAFEYQLGNFLDRKYRRNYSKQQSPLSRYTEAYRYVQSAAESSSIFHNV